MDHLESSFSATAIGVVDQAITLQKPGRVSYEATCWPARLPRAYNSDTQVLDESLLLYPGQQVEVVGREGITLLVVPIGDDL